MSDQDQRRARIREELGGRLSQRLLLVTPGYAYGSRAAAFGMVSAAQRLGVDFRVFDLTEVLRQQVAAQGLPHCMHPAAIQSSCNALLRLVERYRPELLLAIHGGLLPPAVADACRARGVRTAVWVTIAANEVDKFEQIVPHYDWAFCAEPAACPVFLDAGVRHAVELPLAADATLFRTVSLDQAQRERYGTDFVLVGMGYRHRVALLLALEPLLRKLRCRVVGPDWFFPPGSWIADQWENRVAPLDEMVLWYNAGKITLNLHVEDGFNPFGQGSMNRRNIRSASTNLRTFEAAGCGILQIHDDTRESLQRLFDPATELVTCNLAHPEELLGKLVYLLGHPDERISIARAAQRRVHEHHTFEHRLATVLTHVYP